MEVRGTVMKTENFRACPPWGFFSYGPAKRDFLRFLPGLKLIKHRKKEEQGEASGFLAITMTRPILLQLCTRLLRHAPDIPDVPLLAFKSILSARRQSNS